MRRWMRIAYLACCGSVIGAAGCVSLARTEPLQEHYVLGAVGPREDSMPSGSFSELAIGVRRLKLAAYLASPFMVVRRGPNQVDFAEFHRWGEPLEAGINRVIAGLLIDRGFREVVVAPWPAQSRFDYVLQLDVVRFEGMASEEPGALGYVLLLATWEITRPLDGQVLARGTTEHQRRGWRVGDYPGLVTMFDEGIGVIADDLTVALANLPLVTDESRVP